MSDDALLTAELRKLATDCGVYLSQCQRTGQLSSACFISEARESLLKAVHLPGRDERQLVLDTNDESQRAGQGA